MFKINRRLAYAINLNQAQHDTSDAYSISKLNKGNKKLIELKQYQ